MKKCLLILACALIAVSCSKEPIDYGGSKTDGGSGYTAGQSYLRALKAAESAPEMFGAEETKSEFRIIKKGIPVVSDKITKSGVSDTLLYIFNYEGDNGYVMVPKDERKGFVLAYADNGNFNIADTAVNKISKYVLSNVIAYCEAPVSEDAETKYNITDIEYKRYNSYIMPYRGNCSNLEPIFHYDFDDVRPMYPISYYESTGCTATIDVIYLAPGDVDPLLPVCWGQGYPFNLKAPLINGQNAWGGCVAAAAAQIIAYHNFPARYPTGTYVQGVYKGDTETKIESLRTTKYGNDSPGPGFRDYSSTLYRAIGDKLNMNWGLDGSGAPSSNVPIMLRWLGYTSTPAVKTYDIDELEQSLRQGYPVYIEGYDTGTAEAHAYVIDGYKMMHRGYNYYYFGADGEYHNRKPMIYPTVYPPERYVHLNFGWDGSNNGFYLNEAFETSNNMEKFPTKVNYNKNLRMITFIHP